jgi:hypothetical protein
MKLVWTPSHVVARCDLTAGKRRGRREGRWPGGRRETFLNRQDQLPRSRGYISSFYTPSSVQLGHKGTSDLQDIHLSNPYSQLGMLGLAVFSHEYCGGTRPRHINVVLSGFTASNCIQAPSEGRVLCIRHVMKRNLLTEPTMGKMAPWVNM